MKAFKAEGQYGWRHKDEKKQQSKTHTWKKASRLISLKLTNIKKSEERRENWCMLLNKRVSCSNFRY